MNISRLGTLVIFVISLLSHLSIHAQGTPHPPNHVSPANGSTVTSHDVQLCAEPSDSMTDQIHFEIFQAPIPDFSTAWQNTNGGRVCASINVPNGHYTWHARGRNGAGEGGATADWVFTVQADDSPPPTRIPGPEGPTAVPDTGPAITQVVFTPGGGAQIGTTVNIHVEWSCNPNCGAAIVTPSCGNSQAEATTGRYDFQWNTNGCGGGSQSVRICTRSASDPNWTRANCQSPGYTLTGAPAPNSPSADLWADSTTIQSGNCTTLHWSTNNATRVEVNIDGNIIREGSGSRQICPSVTTRYNMRASNGSGNDATRSIEVQVSSAPIPPAINDSEGSGAPQVGPAIAGWTTSDAQQTDIPGGVDLIIYCYAKGYRNAGNSNNSANGWYCDPPNWSANWGQICVDVYGSNYIATNPNNTMDGWRCVTQGSGSSNPPPRQQLPTNCSGVLPPRLQIGQTAVVTQAGFDLNLRAGDGRSQPIRGQLDTGDIVTVIGGPRCTDGFQWWQLQTPQGTWWAAEANRSDYWLAPGNQQPIVQPVIAPGDSASQPGTCGNSLPDRVQRGMRVRVTFVPNLPNRFRSGPGSQYIQTALLPVGSEMEIVGEVAVCADGRWWVEVHPDGFSYTGWTSEGDSTNYWLEPISVAPPVVEQPEQRGQVNPNVYLVLQCEIPPEVYLRAIQFNEIFDPTDPLTYILPHGTSWLHSLYELLERIDLGIGVGEAALSSLPDEVTVTVWRFTDSDGLFGELVVREDNETVRQVEEISETIFSQLAALEECTLGTPA